MRAHSRRLSCCSRPTTRVAVKSSSKPWQAKPYIRPKVQRSLGSFYTVEEAAVAVVHWSLGILPTPPSPPGRNRRGEGRRPRERCKKRALGPLCAKVVDG